MLLHRNSRSEVILWSFDLVITHFSTLVLHHDFLQLFICVQNVRIHIDAWLCGPSHIVHIVIEEISILCARLLRLCDNLCIILAPETPRRVLLLRLLCRLDRQQDLPSKGLKLADFHLSIVFGRDSVGILLLALPVE